MKSFWRAACSVAWLLVFAALLQNCGGSSQSTPLLTITSAALPNGTVGTKYTQQVQASGGVGPYTWGINSGTLPHNLQLGPSSTTTVTISGTPDTPAQLVPFTLKISDSANQTATQGYTVSILGLPDTLSFSPESLVFGSQAAGTATGAQIATLANSGTSAVAITSVTPTGTNAADFSETNTCMPTVAAGGTCEVSVIFTPGQGGPRVASITISDDTEGTPHQLPLTGIGLSAGANATFSATRLVFNGQEVGTTSPAQVLTLINYGEATLNISGIGASGAFSESSSCGATLAPGANCTINVTFSPTASGNVTGALSVSDNVSGSPQIVGLSGSGAASGTAVLTGDCVGSTTSDPNQCGQAADSAECPVGEVALGPTNFLCGSNYVDIDNSRGCTAKTRTVTITDGRCATVSASASSKVARRSCQ